MAVPSAPQRLSDTELREWRQRLLHGDWRLWDLEFFHVLAAALSALAAILVTTAVVAMTRHDGNVGISVGFVVALVALVVVVRGGVRAGLAGAERRTAAGVAHEARSRYLDAVSRGAAVSAGAASTFATRSAADVGTFFARAIPARVVAPWIPLALLGLVAVFDAWSAAICAAVLLCAPFVMVILGRRAAAEAEVGLGRLRSLSARALELLEGAVELRALGALQRGRDELAAATDRAVESTRRSLRIGMQSSTALDVLAGLAVGLVAMVDGFRLLDGQLALGHALVCVLLVVEVFAPLRAAGAAFHAGADGRAALSVLAAVCDEAGPAPESFRGGLAPVAATAPAVAARGAWVTPATGAAPVLRDLDFAVPPKGALVVTGPSGSGKTTLLRAIAGAPLVAGGALLVGNADPVRFSARQRGRLVGAVDQQPFLVAGSIRDNLVLGLTSPDAALLADAVRRCGLAEVAGRFARGLDAPVGEGGRLLSAGERVRVAIARLVVRAPGLVLLDEVGAHLDDAALAALRGDLAEFLAGRTVIEAAHSRPLLAGAPALDLASLAVTP